MFFIFNFFLLPFRLFKWVYEFFCKILLLVFKIGWLFFFFTFKIILIFINIIKFIFKSIRILNSYIQVKLAISSYLRFKKNTILRSKGLPIERTWLESTVNALVKPFRVCLVVHPVKKTFNLAKKFKLLFNYKYSYLTSFQRQICKNIFGFFVGLLVSWILFFFVLENKETNRIVLIIISLSILILITFGFAFSRTIKCIIALIVPTICSSQGRFVIILYVYNLMTMGPVSNSYENLKEIQSSLICSRKVAINETRELINSYLDPIRSIKTVMENVIGSIKRFSSKVQNFVNVLMKLVKKIALLIDKVKEWLKNMNKYCYNSFEKPALYCYKMIDTAEANCRASLGYFFGVLCFVVHVGDVICGLMNTLSTFCEMILKVAKMMGPVIFSVINKVKARVTKEFYANINFTHVYKLEEIKSKTYYSIFDDIKKDLEQKFSILIWCTQFLSFFSLVFTLLILIKALIYLSKFNLKDAFDNIYINQDVKDLDFQRLCLGKETILPLGYKQRKRYIKPFSIRLSSNEKRKLVFGLISLSTLTIQACFWMAIDSVLYFAIEGVKRLLVTTAAFSSVPHLQLDVTGHSALSQFYRELNQNMGVLEKAQDNLMFKCLSVGYKPDYDLYKKIAIILLFAFFTCLIESYALRMRHWIAGKFYPQRRRARSLWLYRQIICSKGTLLKFTRRALRKRLKNDETIEKVSLMERIFAIYPFLYPVRKYFLTEKKFCRLCGTLADFYDDRANFIKCENTGCVGLYCYDCYEELDDKCTLCLNPIEYDDIDDEDEERDSNEEEFEYEYLEDWKYQDTTASESDEPLPKIKLERYSSLDDLDIWKSEESGEEEMSLEQKYKILERELKISKNELLRMKRQAKEFLEEEDENVYINVSKDRGLSSNNTKKMLKNIQVQLQK